MIKQAYCDLTAGDPFEMIRGVEDVINFCSQSVELKSGDLIYTGTPAGVAALVPGDVDHGRY